MRVSEHYEGWVFTGEAWTHIAGFTSEAQAMEWAGQTSEPTRILRCTVIYQDEVRV